VQIDPNTQAPIGSAPLSENPNAPQPSSAPGRRSKKERKVAPTSHLKGTPEMADVDSPEPRVADSASVAVLESTHLNRVVRRLRSGEYNTREVADVIARRLLASGDL
jgi:hypothetical protein